MPVWHEATREARESGELVVLGIIQEQHADRCRLFAQWQGLDWTILHDPINVIGPRAVPIFVALDEAGVVVNPNLRVSDLEDFLARPVEVVRASGNEETTSGDERLDRRVPNSDDANDWIASGDQHLLWENDKNTAIERYSAAVRKAPELAAAPFRLGVAYRARYDSANALPDDFANAAANWDRALKLDPNHYIYRRRIEQYGPRLSKPYPFYDWIEKARAEILARGETPVKLVAEPVGAEIAEPSRQIRATATLADSPPSPPDPDGKITRDTGRWVRPDVVVVPGSIKPGEAVRVHLRLTPTANVHWNNEIDPTKIWVELPEGWEIESQLLELPLASEPESSEPRRIDFELRSSSSAQNGDLIVKAYALDYICEDIGGQCLYRRQDIEIPISLQE